MKLSCSMSVMPSHRHTLSISVILLHNFIMLFLFLIPTPNSTSPFISFAFSIILPYLHLMFTCSRPLTLSLNQFHFPSPFLLLLFSSAHEQLQAYDGQAHRKESRICVCRLRKSCICAGGHRPSERSSTWCQALEGVMGLGSLLFPPLFAPSSILYIYIACLFVST